MCWTKHTFKSGTTLNTQRLEYFRKTLNIKSALTFTLDTFTVMQQEDGEKQTSSVTEPVKNQLCYQPWWSSTETALGEKHEADKNFRSVAKYSLSKDYKSLVVTDSLHVNKSCLNMPGGIIKHLFNL